jgi:hypothetical protein
LHACRSTLEDPLKKAILAFRKGPPNLVCVQAALNYFNTNENFLTRMFTLEYSYWFDYMLPGLDRLRLPIPGTELEFVIMVIAVSCVKLLSAHNSTQHTSRKHKV